MAKVDGVPLPPSSQINERFTEFDPNQQYNLPCKAGVRSPKELYFLRKQGFKPPRTSKAASARGRTKLTTTCRS